MRRECHQTRYGTGDDTVVHKICAAMPGKVYCEVSELPAPKSTDTPAAIVAVS